MPAFNPDIPFLVSACLCGRACRYDGRADPRPVFLSLAAAGTALPVCPEVFGGLTVPRDPCEISPTGVVDAAGKDQTAAFALGAAKTLEIARNQGITQAVFKDKSPSCGVRHIYDGTFLSRLIPGCGMTTALLRRHGIAVFADDVF